MQDIKKSINSDTQSWFKMNERIIHVYCIAGIVALVYAVQYQYHGLEVKVARALESSQTTSELLVGAMSGKVFTKKVRRVARKKRIEPSS
ncbi:transmembrane protein, putative [Bodo saltans]|uniref:Transmembrane protein, putative n=1 Tax=Bodo saltans TaxID=75058 RepID=A0A0S4JNZ3_BODSA|nr:transmembrane protein, putative [Bodo saltans]|eukprot:CUG93266.1 transmembrane protein, putative [Bodo saltans]